MPKWEDYNPQTTSIHDARERALFYSLDYKIHRQALVEAIRAPLELNSELHEAAQRCVLAAKHGILQNESLPLGFVATFPFCSFESYVIFPLLKYAAG
jgi:hypothetical protein